ncbi:hypothetical protein BU16DRAFT_172378 [Lophium mytilinum]|uniref:Uncharacterized protein n=1 Tax=Lophium mytilinum TaxID=390894 RepID=A0A6A6Q9J6_9PEZI|nr:hypothetical protein BU16DRAFT_172378 [Lophium mytilinum]
MAVPQSLIVMFIVLLVASVAECHPLAVRKTQHLTLALKLAIIFPVLGLVLGILAFVFGFKTMKRGWLKYWRIMKRWCVEKWGNGWFRQETPSVQSPTPVQGPTVVLPPPAPIPNPYPVLVPDDNPDAITMGNDGTLQDWVSHTRLTDVQVETEAEEWEMQRCLSPQL